MCDSHAGARALAVAIVASLVVLPAVAPLAAGAGGTTVSLVPADEVIGVDETTTVQVVVDDADGGAGSAEFRVAVDDADTARLVDATVLGSGQVETRVSDDGSRIDVEYAFADTADTGSVVIAEVIVEGVSDGTVDVSLEPAAGNDAMDVYDEAGTGYSVTGTNDARLSVGQSGGEEEIETARSPADSGSGQTGAEEDGAGAGVSDAASGTDSPGDLSSPEPSDASTADASAAGESTESIDSSAEPTDASTAPDDTSSDVVASQTPGQSGGTGSVTTFGTALSTGMLDRAADVVSGPVGIVVAATVVFLSGISLGRRW
jgi:hypothetical protein